ncbi:GNAT family N-acetyltransferase [Chiayiivirga flava]|uniref:RimJ/RimL family protein N-acetyltransferase n=1 Tax=Chiayiivirga flava TaxID=659595 RepID=A0A7W8D6E6_9GAMM|nr:GNAT family N-acetyltransferase [Chiayiivirga flava]MBB5208774.1 RimJ/RimL family protein N-acetyltransferase [Chiayiivirga flava]
MDFVERADALGARLQALPDLPVLDGARVRLRPVRDDDVDGLFAIFSDARVMRYWSRPAMTSREESVAYAARMRAGFRAREVCAWIVADAADDRCLGQVTLYEMRARHFRCEIGYALRADAWGRGLAQESIGTALDWAFGWLGLNRVAADVAPGNDASARVLERLGFRREGTLRENFCNQAELQDSLVFGLLARDWQARRAATGTARHAPAAT